MLCLLCAFKFPLNCKLITRLKIDFLPLSFQVLGKVSIFISSLTHTVCVFKLLHWAYSARTTLEGTFYGWETLPIVRELVEGRKMNKENKNNKNGDESKKLNGNRKNNIAKRRRRMVYNGPRVVSNEK